MNVVELTLTGIAHLGEAIGKHNGKIVFVPYAIPGETVKARIIKDEGDYFRAELVEVITPSFLEKFLSVKFLEYAGVVVFSILHTAIRQNSKK